MLFLDTDWLPSSLFISLVLVTFCSFMTGMTGWSHFGCEHFSLKILLLKWNVSWPFLAQRWNFIGSGMELFAVRGTPDQFYFLWRGVLFLKLLLCRRKMIWGQAGSCEIGGTAQWAPTLHHTVPSQPARVIGDWALRMGKENFCTDLFLKPTSEGGPARPLLGTSW